MTKRILALLMTSIIVLTAVPVSPLADYFRIEAVAADTSELQKVYDTVPPKSEWGKYIDTSVLSAYYDLASVLLSGDGKQEDIDRCTVNLKNAIANLKLHTQAIAFDKTSANVPVGGTLQLTAILTPADAADSIKWQTSDENLATVTDKGLVTVKKYSPNGVTVIASSNNHTASCRINIQNPAAGVKLSQDKLELFENKKATLSALVIGADGEAEPTEAYTITWSSSNDAIAVVSSEGEITGLKSGSCRITATVTTAEGKKYVAGCDVTVSKFIYITSIEPVTIIPEGGFSITEAETRTFSVKINPSNASIKDLTWTSSNEDVVRVSGAKVNGDNASIELKGVKEGVAKITYTATDGSGKGGSFTVNVKPQITSLKAIDTIKVLTLDATAQRVRVEILPENAGNQVLDWTSDNTGVCAVDYDGVLYPNGVGTCFVTAKTKDGSGLSITCKIIVTDLAEKVTLNNTSLSLDSGKEFVLKATVTTTEGEKYTDVVWSSSDEKVATVSSSGVVKALFPGKTTITATAADGSGVSASCEVTVTQPVTGVRLPTSTKVSVGGSTLLQATIIPEYASDSGLTWSSSDESIVTVDQNGRLTGIRTGEAVITCKTNSGGFTATCTVTVVIGVNGITLNKTVLGLNSGESFELIATVTPESATNKQVIWTSSDVNVATVDGAGIVKAKDGGSCIITATTVDGEYSAKCKVSVNQSVAGIEFTDSIDRMYVGQRYQFKARVYPETASNQKINWYTSDSSILLVDTDGNVIARKAGTAEIRIQSENGNHIASCIVTVGNKVSVSGINLDTTEISLQKGAEHLVIATILPSNASDTKVNWFSSNLNVASVDEHGLIKAVGAGQAVITARTNDGNYTAKCKVSVVQPVLGVQFSATDVKVAKGKTQTLVASVIPVNSTNRELIWFSSDSTVATVDQNGLVKGLKSGVTEITATSVDGGYSATCRVTVYVAVTGIAISTSSVTVPKGETRTVTAVVKPSDAANTDLIWSSSNESVATVNGSGVVTGKAKGTATITVETEDGGFRDTCVVEVVQLVTSVSLESTSISLDAGKKKTLTATVSPATASNKNVSWKSSDKNVATVSSKGVVTAVAVGTAVITVTSKDGNASTTCRVTVTQPATGISLNKTKANVDIGSTYTLKATIKPDNATSKYVSWTSSNTKVATVTSKGVVKGLKTGKTTITAATANGEFKASCVITVIKPVTSVSLDKSSVTINVGKTTTLTPTVKPSSASIKTVTYSSSDNDVATVSSKGVITAKGPGYATITVKTKDNSKTDTCRVLVIQPVKSVKLNKTSGTLEVGKTYTLKATVSPSNASNQSVKWSTSNKKVATVSSSGKITAVGNGTATITCKTVDGSKTATFKITVITKVTGVKLNKSSALLYLGKTLTLKATVSPSTASNKTVKWYTSDKKIATVSQKGVVTPVKAGTVTITAKTEDGSFKKTCTVTVERASTSVKLNKTAVILNVGKSYTLKGTITPSDTTDKTLTWKSSNTDVVTVSEKGVIKAVSKGEATITVTTAHGKKATCKVTVKQPVTSVKLSATAITVYMGETAKFSASARPTNANDRKLTYKIANEKVVTLKSGVLTPKKVGKTTITVTSSNGLTATCTVTVKQHVTSLKLNKTSVTLVKGNTFTIVPTIGPSNASEKGVTYTSSDKNVVTVSSKGVITAVKGGTATITVKSKEGNKSAKCKVTVNEPVTGVTLSKTEDTLFVGAKLTLKATVAPEDAYNKAVKWYTSDKTVATVDQNGKITAVAPGKSTITVKTTDGSFKATCVVTVLRKAEKVELNETSITINKGTTFTLVEKVLPEDSHNKNVTWKSSDEKIAVVNNGTVSGIERGEAVITVTTEDGSFTAECKVKVNEPVTSVKLNKNELTLHNGESEVLTATVLPEIADNRSVIWTSSDEKVVSVKGGKVTGLSKGTAIVTVKTEDGGLLDMCNVTVKQNVTEIKVKSESYTVHEGGIINIEAEALPENAESRELIMTSSDESIATVTNGVVKALKKGEATITITSAYTKGITKTIKIVITKAVAGVTVDKTNVKLNVGGTVTLKATITPSDASEQKLLWKSTNEKVATVKDGVVTAKGKGEAKITVETVDGGYMTYCTVTVIQPVTLIKPEKDAYYLYKGETVTVKCEVFPENANDKTLKWSTSDEKVVTVKDGVLTAVGTGTAEITVSDSENVVKTKIAITVASKVEGVTIDKKEVSLRMGETAALTAVITPEDATNKNITWSSSDEKVATIKNGVVTPVGAGTTIITVKTEDGDFIATCLVTVTE